LSTIGRGVSIPGLFIAGMAYFALLFLALVWWHAPPEIVLALSVGGVGLAVLSMRPYVGVHVFIMTLFVEHAIGSGAGITPMKVVGGVVLGGWVVSMGLQRKSGLKFDRPMIVLLLFLVWCGVSLGFALDPAAALIRSLTYAQLALAALMVSAVVDSPERMRRVYWSIVIWTTVSGVLAMVMYYLGMTPHARGLVGNRNLLAMYTDLAIICAYLLYQVTRNPFHRMVLATCLPVLFLGLALTFSRMGLIVLTLALVQVWFRSAKQRKFTLLLGTIGIISVLTFFLPSAFWQRAESIVPAIRNQQDTFGSRVRLWGVGIRVVEDRPIVGVGPGNFIEAFPRYARGGEQFLQGLEPHNTYVSLAAEMGVPGLVLFLATIGFALRNAHRAVLTGRRLALPEFEVFGVVAGVCLLAVLTGGFSGNWDCHKILWLFYGLALAMGRIADRETSGERLAAARIDPAIPVNDLGPWVPARPRP